VADHALRGDPAYGKDKTAEVALIENDATIYRERVIVTAQDAPGSVFAYEAVPEDKSIFTQWLWKFQDRLPALTSALFSRCPPAGTPRR